MKCNKILVLFMIMSVLVTAALAFAGHDHGGGHRSGEHLSAPSLADQQTSKTSEQLLKNCLEQVESIQRHIYRLQAKIAEKRAVSSVNDELEALEQKLIEAKEIVRSLQVY